MSVYTTVSRDALQAWLSSYALGELHELAGIAAGIENTNYFVTTDAGRYVLTLFEKLHREELAYYLGLMTHLAQRDVPSPRPIPNRSGLALGTLCGKPAVLVTHLPGRDIDTPDATHCAAVGGMLARMHLAGLDYAPTMPNPRGLLWWQGAALEVLPKLRPAEAALLQDELRFQAGTDWDALPRGAIHADLFRDNVLFDAGAIGGVIDFYFACTDTLLYDLAITVNDWCTTPSGALDPARTAAMVAAYRAIRAVDPAERDAWPSLLRAAALRFWSSRLYDLHCPRPGELTYAKDPDQFRRILCARIADQEKGDAHLFP